MIISGLLLTLSEDARLAESAESILRARPEFTLAERAQRWLPVVVEVSDVAASRDLHDWLNALPGVDFVDVVQVNFEEDELPQPLTRPSATLFPSDGARDGVRDGREMIAGMQSSFPTQEVTHEH